MFINMVYWTARVKNMDLDNLLVDCAKSYGRKVFRYDGFSPPFFGFYVNLIILRSEA